MAVNERPTPTRYGYYVEGTVPMPGEDYSFGAAWFFNGDPHDFTITAATDQTVSCVHSCGARVAEGAALSLNDLLNGLAKHERGCLR